MIKAEKHKPGKRENPLRQRIGNMEKAYVLFFASWCPFSQRFLPIFEEYSKNNPKECLSVAIDDLPDVCEEYSIEYYPTVILFRKGEVAKRLDAQPGIGLDKKQLKEFSANQPP